MVSSLALDARLLELRQTVFPDALRMKITFESDWFWRLYTRETWVVWARLQAKRGSRKGRLASETNELLVWLATPRLTTRMTIADAMLASPLESALPSSNEFTF